MCPKMGTLFLLIYLLSRAPIMGTVPIIGKWPVPILGAQDVRRFSASAQKSMGKWIYDCSILKERENFCIKHITRLYNNASEAEINTFYFICNF